MYVCIVSLAVLSLAGTKSVDNSSTNASGTCVCVCVHVRPDDAATQLRVGELGHNEGWKQYNNANHILGHYIILKT